jgi:TetR/AcrR family transcriptional regulator, mexJK operon transcriptional repressor
MRLSTWYWPVQYSFRPIRLEGVGREDVDPEQDRSTRKRRAIMDAAAEAFLRDGYRGTSMDGIAAAAQVSKQTVYKHFSDKQRLFAEIVTATTSQAADSVDVDARALADSDDVEADLRDLGRRLLTLVLQPRVLRLRRLVIAEAGRFPELGQMFMQQGVGRTGQVLASAFERLAARGLLEMDDPGVAAAQFSWLIMSRPVNEAMLLGRHDTPDPADVVRLVDDGVRMFMKAYGATPT